MQKFSKFLKNRADSAITADPEKIRYVGLNARLISNMVDMLMLFILTIPLLFFIQRPSINNIPNNAPPQIVEAYSLHSTGEITDEEFSRRVLPLVIAKMLTYMFINILIVGVIYVSFWKYFNSSPGKMLFKAKIVDSKTFQNPTIGQYIIRFIGYIVSALTFLMGFMMIGLNKRKRGLHDYMAGTVVIYTEALNPAWEKKKLKYQTYFMLAVLIIGVIYISKVFE